MKTTEIIIFGIAFIFLMTTLGAALTFFFKKEISQKVNSLFLGLASGIMIAASIWSLLIPAIENSLNYGNLCWLPAACGLIIGGLFMLFLDKIIMRFQIKTKTEKGSNLTKSIKLFIAITIHNIPEGLAVGFAFGAAATFGEHAAFISALGLAIGIGIQNFPEGAAVALPMRNATGNRVSSFLYGMGSGAVEPFAAIIGFYLAAYIAVLQPWLLAFAAGSMIFVVAEDLIPDSKISEHSHIGTWGVMIGFTIMMILDVALG